MENELKMKFIDPEEPLHDGLQNIKWISMEEAKQLFPDQPERLNPEASKEDAIV